MSSIASIPPTTSSNGDSSTLTLPTQTLNQSDFLNLLVTEMQNQDPMNPMSDTDFIAQMAQFSTLQQSQQTYTSIAGMQANDLIGREVTVQAAGSAADTGVVSQLITVNGVPNILVNGQPYTLTDVQSVSPAPATTTSPTTTSPTP